MPLFFAQTFIILSVLLKLSYWVLPASSKIIKLFFLPNRASLLVSSSMVFSSYKLITLSISLGTSSEISLQKLISMLIYLKSKVMMGTLAVFLTESPLTSLFLSSFEGKPIKKCVYLLIKCGTTQIRSISLLLDRRSST